MATVPFSQSRRYPLPSDIAKKLPHNLDAERSVLGAVLLDNAALSVAAAQVNAADFFTPSNTALSVNGRIFMAMLRLADEEKPIDLVTLTVQLKAEGELAAYVSSLADGMPRVSNVAHYAKIVREKSLLRQFIHKTHALQERAWNEDAPLQDLFIETSDAVNSLSADLQPEKKKGLVAVDFCDLLTMDLPPIEYVIDPIVPFRGTTMTFAWRGVGKTYFTMEQAFCVAAGVNSVFGWPIPKMRKVVYVDGELDSSTLQERAQQIARGHGMNLPEPGQLKLIGIDFQEDIRPKINSAEGRRQIEEHLEPGVWLILDNWDTLCPSGGEQDQEVCIEMQDWFLDLRKRQISSTFLHHAGKGGEQRGFSGKEDILGSVLKLREPDDYKRQQGLRAEVIITKLRGKPKPEFVQPFEVFLGASSTGTLQWSMRPLLKLQLQRAFQMFAVDMKPSDVAQELGLKNRYIAHRWRKKFQENPDANAWDPE